MVATVTEEICTLSLPQQDRLYAEIAAVARKHAASPPDLSSYEKGQAVTLAQRYYPASVIRCWDEWLDAQPEHDKGRPFKWFTQGASVKKLEAYRDGYGTERRAGRLHHCWVCGLISDAREECPRCEAPRSVDDWEKATAYAHDRKDALGAMRNKLTGKRTARDYVQSIVAARLERIEDGTCATVEEACGYMLSDNNHALRFDVLRDLEVQQ